MPGEPTANEAQPEELIVFPPTHEQNAPTCHLVESKLEAFLQFLSEKKITLFRDPTPLPKQGPRGETIVQVEVDPKVPARELESVAKEFLRE